MKVVRHVKQVRIAALGRRQHTPGAMNKTEQAFGDELHLWKIAGDVVIYDYEPIKLRLAVKTFYTPDFFAQKRDGSVWFYEVKGHWEEDARVKIKVAARLYPMFHFVAVRRERGAWVFEEIPPC